MGWLARASAIGQCPARSIGGTPLVSLRKSCVGEVFGLRAVHLVICFALATIVSASARADTPAIPSHLTIASEGARPPYNYFDGDKLAGFELDLGRDLCARMAVTCNFVAQDWDSMIPGLLAKRYDAIMAAMEITSSRQTQIAFSAPYIRMPSAFLVQKSTDLTSATPEAMAGRRIGVEQGGTHEAYLTKVYPQARIKRYGSLGDAILDLEAGRVDAAIGDKDAIVTFLKTRRDARCCKILADVPRIPAYFGDGIGIGLRKDDVALKTAFDKALAACIADGSFDKISGRYFDFPIN